MFGLGRKGGKMLVLIGLISCSDINALIVDNYPLEYDVPEAVVNYRALKLLPVVSGLTEITDIQFFPSSNTKALIAQKGGAISVLTIGTPSSVQVVANIPVKTNSGY